MAPAERRKRNAMMLLTAGWVAGFAIVLLLATMAAYQFDTSRFGRDDPSTGLLYTALTVASLAALISATVSIYRRHWGGGPITTDLG